MRIIAGEFRSRRLLTPKDDQVTRPIPDRVKESVFMLLRGQCEGASVFDAFSGTGAIGLEAISRGAVRCVMVEKDRDAAAMLKSNVEMLGAADRCEIVIGDALGAGALARAPRPLDLAFFDPPYPLVRDAIGWKRVKAQFERVIGCLSDDGFAVIRTPWPFNTESPDPNEPIAAPTHRKPKREGKKHWRFRPDKPLETEEPEEPAPVEEESDAAAPGMIKTPGDLSFPNARGPETHVYGSMAVHLYMKKPTGPPPAGV